MNQQTKPGIQTTEFWQTAVINIILATLTIMAYKGLLTAGEAELWLELAEALAAALLPIAMALITAAYSNSRAKVKAGSHE
jgi:hypothetical protein